MENWIKLARLKEEAVGMHPSIIGFVERIEKLAEFIEQSGHSGDAGNLRKWSAELRGKAPERTLGMVQKDLVSGNT